MTKPPMEMILNKLIFTKLANIPHRVYRHEDVGKKGYVIHFHLLAYFNYCSSQSNSQRKMKKFAEVE